MADSSFPVKYPDDYRLVQLLISGDGKAWQVFYQEHRRKISYYLTQRYLHQFSDIEIEEICDNVQERLRANSYRALRLYRGECPFWRYLAEAVEWEARIRLRRRRFPFFAGGPDAHEPFEEPSEEPAPSIISEVLSDELRWTFLLRYYDFFGFPLQEIRLLAKKRRLPIKVITERIVRTFEGSKEGPLWKQIEKQQEVQRKLQQVFREIAVLQEQSDRIRQEVGLSSEPLRIEKLAEIEGYLAAKEQRREKLLKQIRGEKGIVKTPYNVIGQILGESNANTIRGRVHQAKRQLQGALEKKKLGGTQQNE